MRNLGLCNRKSGFSFPNSEPGPREAVEATGRSLLRGIATRGRHAGPGRSSPLHAKPAFAARQTSRCARRLASCPSSPSPPQTVESNACRNLHLNISPTPFLRTTLHCSPPLHCLPSLLLPLPSRFHHGRPLGDRTARAGLGFPAAPARAPRVPRVQLPHPGLRLRVRLPHALAPPGPLRRRLPPHPAARAHGGRRRGRVRRHRGAGPSARPLLHRPHVRHRRRLHPAGRRRRARLLPHVGVPLRRPQVVRPRGGRCRHPPHGRRPRRRHLLPRVGRARARLRAQVLRLRRQGVRRQPHAPQRQGRRRGRRRHLALALPGLKWTMSFWKGNQASSVIELCGGTGCTML
jgi:hypothetical protein